MVADILVGNDGFQAPIDEMQQYGALPWRTDRHGRTRILLITSREQGRWIIPKGWPVRNQPGFVSASREAFEEAGIIGDIFPQPLTDYCYLKRFDDGSKKPCRVTVFSMKVYGTLSDWLEQDQRKRSWFSIEEAADRLDDVELAKFLRANGPFPRKPVPDERPPILLPRPMAPRDSLVLDG